MHTSILSPFFHPSHSGSLLFRVYQSQRYTQRSQVGAPATSQSQPLGMWKRQPSIWLQLKTPSNWNYMKGHEQEPHKWVQWPQESWKRLKINKYWSFHPLSFEVLCHAAIDNWNTDSLAGFFGYPQTKSCLIGWIFPENCFLCLT